jgi:hypothetical protein
MSKLTRIGAVGLELTREEVIEAKALIDGIMRKAQCREANEYIVDTLDSVSKTLDILELDINATLEEGE